MLLGNARDFTDLARGAPQRSRLLREVGDAGQLRGAGTGGGGAETSEGGGQQPSHHRHGEAAPRQSVGRSIDRPRFFPSPNALRILPSCPSFPPPARASFSQLPVSFTGSYPFYAGYLESHQGMGPVRVNIPDWYHES